MVDPGSAAEVREALVAHLRASTSWVDARCPAPLQPVLGGNQSFVYGLELEASGMSHGPLILRILRPFLPQESVGRESVVQNVLREAGYPTARVWYHCADPSVLGGAFQLMERLPGRPIVGAASETQGTIGLKAALADFRTFVFGPWPEQVAALQHRLHSLSLDALLKAFEAAGLPADEISFSAALARLAERAERAGGLSAIFAWLLRGAADFESHPKVLCHGDFFPNQVLTHGEEITGVIDWSDVCIAPAELDVTILKVGIETLPVPIPFGGPVLRSRARAFFATYSRLARLDPAALEYAEALRCAHSLLGIAERGRSLSEDPDASPNPNPYDSPATRAELSARLEGLTACRVAMPSR